MVRASLEIGNSNQELMEKPGRRKWRIWATAVSIFVIIIILVAAAVILLTGGSEEGNNDRPTANPITLKEIMEGQLSPNRFNGTWISDDQVLFVDRLSNLVMHNVKDRKNTIVLPRENPLMDVSFDHQLSPDHKYILFAFNYRKLYRHTYSAQYLVMNLETSSQYNVALEKDWFLDLAVWGPQGNSLAYVYKNNLYFKKSVLDDAQQLSSNGIPGIVYNGVPDWVYEEEIFSSNKAIWFSDDGSHVAYGSFNDTLTRIMPIPFYGNPGDPDSQYTRALAIRYPKAGTENPIASLVLTRVSDSSPPIELSIPSKLHQPILASVSFVNNASIAAVWMNRVQNESVIVLCDPECTEIFSYDEPNGWIDMLRPLIFINDGSAFLTILPKAIGEDYWRQIALVSRGSDAGEWTVSYITDQPNTVTELVHFDKETEILWYIATSADDSAFQHLYSVSLDGKIDCFTCKIRHSSGSECLYNEIFMSKGGSNIIVSCLGPQVPEVYIYSKTGAKLIDWDTNDKIAKLLRNKTLPVITRMTIQVAEKPLPPAHVLLMMPPNADLSGNTKYPMLVNVYGGPDSYQVLEKWNMDWSATLVTRWNIALALIDGRGSGLKGNNNLFAIYRKLGTVEINDQVNVTRKLQNQLNYIDPERTCIWGWSYGGYASALALAHGGDTFRCAVSVAPVTDWVFYDSIYTERYMGLPNIQDNLQGYSRAQLNSRDTALKMEAKKFMLVHGTLDDNVHYQQSMMLSRVLQQNDVMFTQMSYPDEDHGLNGVKYHLYHSIEKFLQTNLVNATN